MTNIGSDSCNVDLFALTQTLKHECEINLLFEAWELCESIDKWYINYWSHIMKILAKSTSSYFKYYNLWKQFFKTNIIKSHL